MRFPLSTCADRPLRCCGSRQGVAAVEAAIALPLLILLVFGALEIANGIFLTQTLAVAAYEGAREAVRPGGTPEQVQQRIEDLLVSRGVHNFTVSIVPELTASTPSGTPITVEVRAPMNALAPQSIGIIGDRVSIRRACMARH